MPDELHPANHKAGLLVCWEYGYLSGMKMTFDLPADIAQRLKVKAAEEGLKLKDLIAEACRMLLDEPRKPKSEKSKQSPFPLFKGGKPAKPSEEMTPERVAEILWGSGE